MRDQPYSSPLYYMSTLLWAEIMQLDLVQILMPSSVQYFCLLIDVNSTKVCHLMDPSSVRYAEEGIGEEN